MFCGSCGKQLFSNEKFCSQCGARTAQASQDMEKPAPIGTQTTNAQNSTDHYGAQYDRIQYAQTEQNETQQAPAYKPPGHSSDTSPRLGTLSGCGTGFCGATNHADDGSFITTAWIKILGIPLIPMASYRIALGYSSSKFSGVVHSEVKQYYIYSREKLKISQVIRIYLHLIGFPILFFSLVSKFMGYSSYVSFSGFQTFILITIIIVFLILAYLFWRVK